MEVSGARWSSANTIDYARVKQSIVTWRRWLRVRRRSGRHLSVRSIGPRVLVGALLSSSAFFVVSFEAAIDFRSLSHRFFTVKKFTLAHDAGAHREMAAREFGLAGITDLQTFAHLLIRGAFGFRRAVDRERVLSADALRKFVRGRIKVAMTRLVMQAYLA